MQIFDVMSADGGLHLRGPARHQGERSAAGALDAACSASSAVQRLCMG